MSQDILENEIDRSTHEYKPNTIRSVKNKEKAAKNRYYVDKAAFYQALVERKAALVKAQEEGTTTPRITDFVGKCIVDIATNMSRKYNFSGYAFRDEMVGDAVEHCLRHIDSFDITKSANPFAYFTQACYFIFIGKIQSEKKEIYIKCKSMLNHAAYGMLSQLTEDSDELAEHIHDNFMFKDDFVEKFVEDYEAKHGLNAPRKSKSVERSPLDDLIDDEEVNTDD